MRVIDSLRVADGMRGRQRHAVHCVLFDLPFFKREIKFKCARGEPQRIVRCSVRRQRTASQIGRHESVIETHGPESHRFGQRRDQRGFVDEHGAVSPCQVMDRTDATQLAKTLPWRCDLKRTQQHEQARAQGVLAKILEAITHSIVAVHGRFGFYAQTPIRVRPNHGWHGHPIVLEFLS